MLFSRCQTRSKLRATSFIFTRSISTISARQQHVHSQRPSRDRLRLDKHHDRVTKNTGLNTSSVKQHGGTSVHALRNLEIPDNAPVTKIQTKKGDLPHICASFAQKHIYLWQEDCPDRKSVLQAQAIRDSCPCSSCRDPFSGQKSFATTQVPVRMHATGIREVPEGLAVTFDVDVPGFSHHETIITRDDMEAVLERQDVLSTDHPGKHSAVTKFEPRYWDAEQIRQRMDGPGHSYTGYMEDGETLWNVVSDLAIYGISFLKDVPADPEAIIQLGTKIANIQETFYGRTFDVRAKPNADNVAYTNGYLGLHQDLLYLQAPPKIQILHCMENSCEGGASLFADGDRVGRMLYANLSEIDALRPLAEVEIPYAYKMNGYNYEQLRPLLSGDVSGRSFSNLWWSPPFQGRFVLPHRNMGPWIRAARVFESMINHPRNVYERMMQPGECVLFDNHRVLHGRNAFDVAGGGSRWFRGTYISEEDFYSKVSRMPREVMPKANEGDSWTDDMSRDSTLLKYMKEEMQKALNESEV